MSLRFLHSPLVKTAVVPKPAIASVAGSHLSQMTATYRQQQTNQTAATTKNIDQLALQRRRLATAGAKADKPIDTYLKRSGELVERRIGSLQAHLNQILGKDKS